MRRWTAGLVAAAGLSVLFATASQGAHTEPTRVVVGYSYCIDAPRSMIAEMSREGFIQGDKLPSSTPGNVEMCTPITRINP